MAFFQGTFGKIFYQVEGEGFPLLFVHGLGSSHKTWFRQIPFFRNKYQTIVLDLAGSGKSATPDDSVTMEKLSEDIVLLIDHLKLTRLAMVGSSMGGMLAQLCLKIIPEKITATVLGSTSPGGHPHLSKILRPLLYSHKSAAQRIRETLPLLFSDTFLKSEKEILGEYLKATQAASPKLDCLKMIVRAFLKTEKFSKKSLYEGPVSILVGDADPVTPPDMAEEVKGLFANSRLHLIAEAKHLVHIEKAPVFNYIVQSFLEEFLE